MGIVYLDTHVVVWLYAGLVEQLGVQARKQIEEHDLLISPAALLELEYLKEIGRVKTPGAKVLAALSDEIGLEVCDLPFGRVVQAAMAERWVRDPFDRLIVGQAKANEAPLVTKDERIRTHYRRAVW